MQKVRLLNCHREKEKKTGKLHKNIKRRTGCVLALMVLLFCSACGTADFAVAGKAELVNVSYDATREFYTAYNQMFSEYWEQETGQEIEIIQSHGGSGKQALEVANGLDADVVTLALEADIQTIADADLIEENFIGQFGTDSSPYTSTIVFLVRAGNPKNIHDWDDLLQEGVGIITPNPKTSGGARWNYLAAWYYFEKQGKTETEILACMKKLYQNVLVLDSGARSSATTFVENGQGDVLIAWENEAFLSMEEAPGEYEIIIPSASILCQPTVAVVNEVTERRGSSEAAEAYLGYLYSEAGQQLAVKNYYRPVDENVFAKHEAVGGDNEITEIPADGRWICNNLDLVNIGWFGGWEEAERLHFAEGGFFDLIYERN